MSHQKAYDELLKALIPKQPHNPQYGHQGPQQPGYPVNPYPPTGPYYMGNAPIQYPPQYRDYPVEQPHQPPVEPYPPMPPHPPRPQQPRKIGPSWVDGALIFVIGFMFLAFIFGIFSG